MEAVSMPMNIQVLIKCPMNIQVVIKCLLIKVLELDVWMPAEVVCAMACYIVSCRVCFVFCLRCVSIFQNC